MSGWTIVTGAAGFIGGHLVDALIAGGRPVLAIDLPGRIALALARHRGASMLRGLGRDVGDLEVDEVRAALPTDARVDAVVHLAAQIFVPRSLEDPIGDVRDNVIGSLRCFEVGHVFRAKVIFASSAAVYGDAPAGPVAEAAAGWPRSPYGVDKLAAEMHLRVQARERGLRGVALRFFNVYGPRQDPQGLYAGVIARFFERARRGEPLEIFGDGAQTRDFIFVSDVVAAILAAIDRGPIDGSAVNLGSGVETSIVALARAVIAAAGSASAVVHAPGRAGEIRRSCAVVDRMHADLGLRARVDLARGLAAIAGWLDRGDDGRVFSNR